MIVFTFCAMAVAVAPLLLWPSLVSWYYDIFLGMYAGFMGYRIVYGLVLPVPEPALGRI